MRMTQFIQPPPTQQSSQIAPIRSNQPNSREKKRERDEKNEQVNERERESDRCDVYTAVNEEKRARWLRAEEKLEGKRVPSRRKPLSKRSEGSERTCHVCHSLNATVVLILVG